MKTLLVLLAAVKLNVWLVNPQAGATANEALRRVLPEVHSVTEEGEFAVVRSAGLSTHYLGPLQNPPSPENAVREFVFRIPKQPRPAAGKHPSIGAIGGVFVNGMPIYSMWEAASYQGRNLWHYDLVAEAAKDGAARSELLENVISDNTRHSPVLGYALDGYPVYGPWTEGGRRRMRSSYQLRRISGRETWADGTRLTPGQYGPAVSAEFPLGTFVEDYEYVAGSGDLDAYNGAFVRTPEYPEGTYAYFLATDAAGRMAFPYLLAGRFHGELPEQRPDGRMLTFDVPHRQLEHVHEKPLHLIVASEDLAFFDHVHPAPNARDQYEIAYDFPAPGRYHLWADYTAPGEGQRIVASVIAVKATGKARSLGGAGLQVTLQPEGELLAGEEVTFQVSVSPADYEPFLGAWAHLVLIDESRRHFLHAHPEQAAVDPELGRVHIHGVTDAPLGPPPPVVPVKTVFPEAGRYKVWVQLQRQGKVITTPFWVNVKPARAKAEGKAPALPGDAIRVTVNRAGFTPARIETPAGKPFTLAITRESEPNCGSRIVFPNLKLERELPLGATTLVAMPAMNGELRFTCGMGMYRGVIVAVAP